MKKSFYLVGTVLILASTFSCSTQEQPKKNYYGVIPSETQGVSQQAYYTFAGLIIILAILLAMAWKKIKK